MTNELDYKFYFQWHFILASLHEIVNYHAKLVNTNINIEFFLSSDYSEFYQ